MTDIIRKSELLQKFVNGVGVTKEDILDACRKEPGVVSAEYSDGILIIKTALDPVPIVIDIKLKDRE